MPQGIQAIDPDAINVVTEITYYKRLQKQLREKRGTEESHYNTTDTTILSKQKKTAKPLHHAQTDKHQDVYLKPFSWQESSKPAAKRQETREIKQEFIAKETQKVKRFFGMKIDFSARIAQMKESFMQNVTQSRSHNFFLARYATFKVGVLGQLLSVLGVAQDELQRLKKKALNMAIAENMELMSENVYNLELSQLFYGHAKKARRAQRMFQAMQAQLIDQLDNLGRKGYWNKGRMLEEKIRQCKRIDDELSTEKQHLEYQIKYHEQEIDQ